MSKTNIKKTFAFCIENRDCDDLIKRKVYRIITDENAAKDGYLRIVDESGEDYLYPEFYFVRIQLPLKAEEAIMAEAE